MFFSRLIAQSPHHSIDCPCRVIYTRPCTCDSSGLGDDPDDIYRLQILLSTRIAALAGFNSLLPDAGVELFEQHLRDAFSTFHLFPELPEELRIMVVSDQGG